MQGVPLLTSDARVHAVGSVHKFRRGLSGALLPTRTLGLNDGGERFCVWSISALGMVGERECPRNCVGMIERKRHAFINKEKSRVSEGL